MSAIVIKPTLVGSLARCQQLVKDTHQAGLTAVISSSIESSLGLTQLARLAHWLTPDTIRAGYVGSDAGAGDSGLAGEHVAAAGC